MSVARELKYKFSGSSKQYNNQKISGCNCTQVTCKRVDKKDADTQTYFKFMLSGKRPIGRSRFGGGRSRMWVGGECNVTNVAGLGQ